MAHQLVRNTVMNRRQVVSRAVSQMRKIRKNQTANQMKKRKRKIFQAQKVPNTLGTIY